MPRPPSKLPEGALCSIVPDLPALATRQAPRVLCRGSSASSAALPSQTATDKATNLEGPPWKTPQYSGASTHSGGDAPTDLCISSATPDDQQLHEPIETDANSISATSSTGDTADIKLWSPSASRILVASQAAAAFLFVGLSLLGLGERNVHEGPMLFMRVLAWCVMCLFPMYVCTSNVAGFLMFGVAPRQAPWMQILVPSIWPPRLAGLARELGHTPCRAAAGSMVLHVVPLVVSAVLLLVPFAGPGGRFGLVIVYGIGALISRPPSLLLMHTLLPGLAKSMRYFRGIGLASMGFTLIGFYAIVGAHSTASHRLGVWPDLLLVPVLVAYELLGVFLIEENFVGRFVAEPRVRSLFTGSRQGIFPSLGVMLLHGNAEAARFALLLNRAVSEADWSFTMAMATSFFVQVTFRTGWFLKLAQCTPIGKQLYQTNMVRHLNSVKYYMGYPRFFAMLALVAARLALGHEAFPSGIAAATAALMFAQEVLEDATVFLAHRWGLDAHRLLATPEWDGGAPFAPGAAAPSPKSAFRCRPDLAPVEAMPLWAHFVAIFPTQLHFVLCCAFSGWGVPLLLGYCSAPPEEGGCAGRGVFWWPPMDLQDPCRCRTP